MFLTPRRSKIDIVQAVGRVMRKPPGKQLGYVILPIAITAGLDPSSALDKNTEYDAVWEVLQALRAHDERFNAYINRIALSSTKPGEGPDDPIKVIPVDVLDDVARTEDLQGRLFAYEEWTNAIYTKIVQRVGSKGYWEKWADDVTKIAARHETRINSILKKSPEAAATFDEFLAELHATLNDSISRADDVSMLSQHLITRPIFEALFGDDSFGQTNPVSVAMNAIVELLEQHELQSETKKLDEFFASIRRRVEGIHPDDGEARQRIIKDLYGRFFKLAFPKVAESLGIVYTPLEVVDFIIRAVEAALVEHFDASLSNEGVHVLDPFTGTGTFITRLIQSGFVSTDDLARKFTDELHANELLLLAYYIAAVNIETTYRQEQARRAGDDPGYQAFPGIVLTDTFQLGEAGAGTGKWDVFPLNNERAAKQRTLDIRVIFGNPPYSAGQGSANDNNANLKYPTLDASIAATYAKRSSAKLKNSLYDSYIRAIRWASDRLFESPHGGVVAFVTNGGYIDSNTADGLRSTLVDEFHHLYIFNLRGNQRTAGEVSKREGGKIFEAGSRATVAISVLVKKPGDVPPEGGTIHYRDIGDYLSRNEKLKILADTLPAADGAAPSLASGNWTILHPNKEGDWINQRSEEFASHMPAAPGAEDSIFTLQTTGLKTNRDAWNYNSSRPELDNNVARMIKHYNEQATKFAERYPDAKGTIKERANLAKSVTDLDPKKFSWDHSNFTDMAHGRLLSEEDRLVMVATYRPFHSRWVEAGRRLNNRVYQLPRVFPDANTENLAIGCAGMGGSAPFTPFMTKRLPDTVATGAGNVLQWFPRYVHPKSALDSNGQAPELFDGVSKEPKHNVTSHSLRIFQKLDEKIGKDDVFFYVYGVMHSTEYRFAYAADLKRTLPRIPQPQGASDFWAFAAAGRELAFLHTEYDEVEPWPTLTFTYGPGFDPQHPDAYRVLKMKHPKVADPTDATGPKVDDRTRIIYNDWITIGSVPERAYEYQLGSRSALGWVLEANRVRTDTASRIRNDPNDWAVEHETPTYLLDLVARVVTVCMRTLDIVDSLPSLGLLRASTLTGQRV